MVWEISRYVGTCRHNDFGSVEVHWDTSRRCKRIENVEAHWDNLQGHERLENVMAHWNTS